MKTIALVLSVVVGINVHHYVERPLTAHTQTKWQLAMRLATLYSFIVSLLVFVDKVNLTKVATVRVISTFSHSFS